jgi:N4-gp56 family major capsid protein
MANINAAQTNMQQGIKTEYSRRLLVRAIPRFVHGRWATPSRLNQYGSIEWRRYESYSAITTALTEAVTPDELAQPTITLVTGTPSWYGAWVGYTDKMKMTAYDPLIAEVVGLLGEQAGLSIDTLIRNSLTDGATKDYANGVAGRTSLAAPADKLTYADVVQQISLLMNSNARGVMGEDYAVIVHPFTWSTLMQDPVFVTLFTRAEPGQSNPLRTGYLGRLLNCQFFISSNSRSYTDGGASNADVYSMLFIGAESHGIVGVGELLPNVNAMDSGGPGYANQTGARPRPVDVIVKDLGENGNDPLNMRGTVGWKTSHGQVITQSAFIRDLEHITDQS